MINMLAQNEHFDRMINENIRLDQTDRLKPNESDVVDLNRDNIKGNNNSNELYEMMIFPNVVQHSSTIGNDANTRSISEQVKQQ